MQSTEAVDLLLVLAADFILVARGGLVFFRELGWLEKGRRRDGGKYHAMLDHVGGSTRDGVEMIGIWRGLRLPSVVDGPCEVMRLNGLNGLLVCAGV